MVPAKLVRWPLAFRLTLSKAGTQFTMPKRWMAGLARAYRIRGNRACNILDLIISTPTWTRGTSGYGGGGRKSFVSYLALIHLSFSSLFKQQYGILLTLHVSNMLKTSTRNTNDILQVTHLGDEGEGFVRPFGLHSQILLATALPIDVIVRTNSLL